MLAFLAAALPMVSLARTIDDASNNLDFRFSRATTNNLGTLGPNQWQAALIKYESVTKVGENQVDMEVYNMSAYLSTETSANGVNGEFGIVNVAQNSRVDLRFRFVDHNTNMPVILQSFYFSFMDIDQGESGESMETVTVGGMKYFFAAEHSEVRIVPQWDGRYSFQSTSHGVFDDNPKHPRTLTPIQRERTVTLYFEDTNRFDATFTVSPGRASRHFMFAGASSLPDFCDPTPATFDKFDAGSILVPKPLQGEFNATLVIDHKGNLSSCFGTRGHVSLEVTNILGGPIQIWNQRHENDEMHTIRAGDSILAVDGFADSPERMLRRLLDASGSVDITVQRLEASISASSGSQLGSQWSNDKKAKAKETGVALAVAAAVAAAEATSKELEFDQSLVGAQVRGVPVLVPTAPNVASNMERPPYITHSVYPSKGYRRLPASLADAIPMKELAVVPVEADPTVVDSPKLSLLMKARLRGGVSHPPILLHDRRRGQD